MLQRLHQALQRPMHVAADTSRTHFDHRLGRQQETFAEVVDVQAQRVVGPLFHAQGVNPVPGRDGLLGRGFTGAVPIVQQRAE
ncbi:hypothetical protein ALO79_200194 [Pseudomonas syringae pv. castaneae]|uniref:Uncharacterized protein n=1 Tax=Pseudomonas syringae pv. castaneae TaxID=264450 RepID=A0A0P9MPJ8_PSESX|nr:hypothetical protein ALO79_200194 [Pseudomonas syringae pv. castaneae]